MSDLNDLKLYGRIVKDAVMQTKKNGKIILKLKQYIKYDIYR